ncbi:tRNA lysidine(34) synthetase TilS [Nocardia asteroides]|uniref:tRNA lysidine(34) synthetase TilS n=1 Tax=Nocardia asteroides TaxID=1824 RepID=UPI001E2C3DE3|nr:tRNA lysidine(34) synthetase TilS [Nocardia asteroides]UGT52970.1 tRNA lysidine(34) synthetase TilS [Nocardia asteroides]
MTVRLPETAAVLAVRRGVREWMAARGGRMPVVVGLSGGADSLALAAAAVVEAGDVTAVVVDHQLQPGSGEVAAGAAAQALALGCVDAVVVPVEVGRNGGVEAAARAARYAALESARAGRAVLLGHTLDDQAETVLLGLARGSGGRSIQGMAAWNEPWGRPLLGVRRAQTRQMCVDLGIEPWEDPHNLDPAYTRVRLRTEVLPLLEDVLGGGVAQALARTADQLRDDGEVLDALTTDLLRAARADSGPADTGRPTLSLEILTTAPAALRRRTIRAWLAEQGVSGLLNAHLQAIDELVSDWRGQGGVAVAGGGRDHRLVVAREHGTLTVRAQPRLDAT